MTVLGTPLLGIVHFQFFMIASVIDYNDAGYYRSDTFNSLWLLLTPQSPRNQHIIIVFQFFMIASEDSCRIVSQAGRPAWLSILYDCFNVVNRVVPVAGYISFQFFMIASLFLSWFSFFPQTELSILYDCFKLFKPRSSWLTRVYQLSILYDCFWTLLLIRLF